MAERIVANPGSTLGEAIGMLVELEVNRLLRPIAEENGCVYITAGPINPRTGRATKLLLKDAAGNEFQIDAVIANKRRQPLVLIESKYIRYTKHNRDKGSWVCTAHYSLRRTFPTIRKSIAVLVGNWSAPSKAMMKSFDQQKVLDNADGPALWSVSPAPLETQSLWSNVNEAENDLTGDDNAEEGI